MGGGTAGFSVLFLLFVHVTVTENCGVSTHIEIAHRATQYFEETSGGINYKKLILEHQDAFQAGNPYPDAYYDSICQGGKYHDVSEDTHWAPFLNATINYIRDKYPQPWDKATEKLVVFMLGFASHQVADVSWHSLGIDQGFLDTMGKVNFYGSFEDAHSVGDPGGDTIVQVELDESYVGLLTEWYVPVNDLLAIYTSYYGDPNHMKKGVVEECTALLFLARLGEKIAMARAFHHYGSESPFMVDDFYQYFLGGVDDMATWTTNVWREAIFMLEKGTSACDIPHSPLFIDCTKNNTWSSKVNPRDNTKMKGLRTRLTHLQDFSLSDVNMTWTDRGVYFAPAQHIKNRFAQINKEKKQTKFSTDLQLVKKNAKLRTVYTTTNSYSKTGWSMLTRDINNDGLVDLVIGAPNYGRSNQAQNGRVYIVYGNEDGIPDFIGDKANLDSIANVGLDGIKLNGRFGMAIAALDFNKDGMMDLVVSAPSVGSPQLNYTGEVYVFLSTADGQFLKKPNVTIQCEIHYCNLGWSLASDADFNSDGYPDLVIGSPYASKTGKQRGMVNVFYSSGKWTGVHTITERAANSTLHGDQDYGWFGYYVKTSTVNFFGSFLIVTQPTYRICALPDCTYSKNDTQSVGRISLYSVTKLDAPKLVMTGNTQFEKLGSMVAIGDPYQTGHSIMAVGSDTKDIMGAFWGFKQPWSQAGQVKLYNLTRELTNPAGSTTEEIAVFEGDRELDRFGQMIDMADVNGDGIDDVIITAPLRIEDMTDGEIYPQGEEGAIYVYAGSKTFPMGNVTRVDCMRNCDNCGEFHLKVEPCPDLTASAVAASNERGGRFGTTSTVWKQGQKTYLVVGAPNSNQGSRLSGAVYIYNITLPTN